MRCHHLPRELGAAAVPRTQALGADPTSEAVWACERQQGPSSWKPGQIPISRAGVTTISCRERIWDFPGCCKLDSDFAPGAKFSVITTSLNSPVDLPGFSFLCRQCFLPSPGPPAEQHNPSCLPAGAVSQCSLEGRCSGTQGLVSPVWGLSPPHLYRELGTV